MRTLEAAAFRGRLLATLRLQYPDTLADAGFRLLHPETGDRYTGEERHLVATCRSIANFAAGVVVDGPPWCRDAAAHGLAFLEDAHRADDGEGYHVVVDAEGTPIDRTRTAYGHAFVLLAYARATEAGIDGAAAGLEATADLLERRFHDGTGCLRSDCDPDWNELEAYRGQNANMHACEAYIAAYEATDDQTYLDRARDIAGRITVDLAAETDGLLWEHYGADWDHEFGYNADEPRHQFRPPGYQPGHHVEWAKFLALLDRYDDAADPDKSTAAVESTATVETTTVETATVETATTPEDGWYARAVDLFDAAVELGWTENGFVYTHEADGTPIVSDQYGWALAEAIGASAALAERVVANGDDDAAERFTQLNRRFTVCTDLYRGPAGIWYEKRLPPNEGGDFVAPEPPGVEPDYHPASAYFESWRSANC